jgi:hypothetical protein
LAKCSVGKTTHQSLRTNLTSKIFEKKTYFCSKIFKTIAKAEQFLKLKKPFLGFEHFSDSQHLKIHGSIEFMKASSSWLPVLGLK